jgi:hypothetical protein
MDQTPVAAKVASLWVTAAAWAIVMGDSTAGWLGVIVGVVVGACGLHRSRNVSGRA